MMTVLATVLVICLVAAYSRWDEGYRAKHRPKGDGISSNE